MSATCRAVVLVAALLGPGCMFGVGTPYPGAGVRKREFSVYQHQGGGWYTYVGEGSETGGGGALGATLGIRTGGGLVEIGEGTDGHGAFVTEIGGELHYALHPRLGVGLGAAYQFTLGQLDPVMGDGGDFSWRRIPVIAYGQVVPLRPFFLRAGVGYSVASHVSVDDTEVGSGAGPIYAAGAGMAMPWPGLHYTWLVEWQRANGGDLEGPGVSGPLQADQYLVALWLLW